VAVPSLMRIFRSLALCFATLTMVTPPVFPPRGFPVRLQVLRREGAHGIETREIA